MQTTMMNTPLSLDHLLERAGQIFHGNDIVSRLPDKSLKRHSYAEYYRRTRALASALLDLGLQKGECVATLCWHHHAHLEAYFSIPAAGGVMHTLNLRLSPEEIGWIAGDAEDRFLIIDDVLLPRLRPHLLELVDAFGYSPEVLRAPIGGGAGADARPPGQPPLGTGLGAHPPPGPADPPDPEPELITPGPGTHQTRGAFPVYLPAVRPCRNPSPDTPVTSSRAMTGCLIHSVTGSLTPFTSLVPLSVGATAHAHDSGHPAGPIFFCDTKLYVATGLTKKVLP